LGLSRTSSRFARLAKGGLSKGYRREQPARRNSLRMQEGICILVLKEILQPRRSQNDIRSYKSFSTDFEIDPEKAFYQN